MNEERMLQLADYMEKVPEGRFDMGFIVNSKPHSDYETALPGTAGRLQALAEGQCGTAGCIAGHAAAFFKLYEDFDAGTYGVWSEVQHYLGLSDAEAMWLFDNAVWWAGSKAEGKDPRSAANAIRCLATMGLRNCWRGDKVLSYWHEYGYPWG